VNLNEEDLDRQRVSSAQPPDSLSTNVKRRLGHPPGLIPLLAARAIGEITPLIPYRSSSKLAVAVFFSTDLSWIWICSRTAARDQKLGGGRMMYREGVT
jgi:hypothetical protein